MSRNISTVEKVAILIVIMGAILGLGIYFIVIPANNSVRAVDTQIEDKRKQIDSALELKAREIHLVGLMAEKRERAEHVNEGFFDEMTHTEAVTLVQDILNNADFGRGFIAEYGIFVEDIEEEVLALQLFLGRRPAEYALREFATLLNPTIEEEYISQAIQIIAEIGEEWNPALMAAKYLLGENADELELLEKMFEFAERPTDFMLTLTEMLKGTDLSEEDRIKLLDFMRLALAIESSGIGVIRAEFSLRLLYNEYLDFLDYLHAYDMRIAVHAARFFHDNDASIVYNDEFDETTGLADYDFELYIYVVLPMDLPEIELPAQDEDTGADETDAEEAEASGEDEE